mmetsp:Transcript_20342/g.60667  ORF Transcript_20342/g.60667 Transcript_20342/m.60667 type:complete len:135 (-) Transcript_20342:36-440(-)
MAFEDMRATVRANVAYVEPCVLHYLTCGEFWLRTKYELLGAFDNAWFGVAMQDPTHLDAFYAMHLAPPVTSELAHHIVAGVLRRELSPAVLLYSGHPRVFLRTSSPAAPETEAPVRPSTCERAWVLAAAAATFL